MAWRIVEISRTRTTTRVLALVCAATATLACGEDDAGSGVLRGGAWTDGDVIEGRFETLVARLDDGSTELIHRVVDGDTRTRVFFAEPPAIAPRTWIRAWGDETGDALVVGDFEILALPPEPLIDADPFAPRTLGLVLLHWGEPALDLAEAESRMWSDAKSSAQYYAEISYGKETLTGDVLGPYEIAWPGGCNSDAIAQYAQAAIAADGKNPNDYQQLMYHFPSIGCGWGGLAMLGSPDQPERDSWYNGQFDCVVRNQEVAHNYGIMHTHFYYGCGGGAPFGSNCNYEEYGSPYEPMGYGCGHMAAHQKEYMGWLEGCNVVSATADGTFNLLPLETPCDGIQALKLPTYDGREYYLEYRQPIGFDVDDGLSGVLVYVSSYEDYWGPDGYMIDLGEGAFLAEGDSYSDPDGTVTFTVREQFETHAVIDVLFPGGGSGAPACNGGGEPESQAGSFGTLSCLGGPFVPDGEAPLVRITSPADGSGFEPGDDLSVTVEALDDVQVHQVALYVNDELQGSLASPPWVWDFDALLVGEYKLVAVASDGINEGESMPVTIEVKDGAGDDGSMSGDDDGAASGDDDGSEVGDGGDEGDEDGESGFDHEDVLPPGFGLGVGEGGCACASGRQRPTPALLGLVLVTAWRRVRRGRAREGYRAGPGRCDAREPGRGRHHDDAHAPARTSIHHARCSQPASDDRS